MLNLVDGAKAAIAGLAAGNKSGDNRGEGSCVASHIVAGDWSGVQGVIYKRATKGGVARPGREREGQQTVEKGKNFV